MTLRHDEREHLALDTEHKITPGLICANADGATFATSFLEMFVGPISDIPEPEVRDLYARLHTNFALYWQKMYGVKAELVSLRPGLSYVLKIELKNLGEINIDLQSFTSTDPTLDRIVLGFERAKEQIDRLIKSKIFTAGLDVDRSLSMLGLVELMSAFQAAMELRNMSEQVMPEQATPMDAEEFKNDPSRRIEIKTGEIYSGNDGNAFAVAMKQALKINFAEHVAKEGDVNDLDSWVAGLQRLWNNKIGAGMVTITSNGGSEYYLNIGRHDGINFSYRFTVLPGCLALTLIEITEALDKVAADFSSVSYRSKPYAGDRFAALGI